MRDFHREKSSLAQETCGPYFRAIVFQMGFQLLLRAEVVVSVAVEGARGQG